MHEAIRVATSKSRSPRDVVQAIQALEDRADFCFDGLELLDRNAWNVGMWAGLVQAAAHVEGAIPHHAYGGKTHQIVLTNLSRIMPIMCDWCRRHGEQRTAPVSRFQWTRARAIATSTAFEAAAHYMPFCATFPAWHRDLVAAEMFEPAGVTFIALDNLEERRVSAYRKGMGPGNAPVPPVERPPDLENLIREVLGTVQQRGLEIHYPRPERLLRSLNEAYQSRLAAAFRRYEGISVGDYSLQEFRTVYAALTAVAAAREHICFRSAQINGRYPLESAVFHYAREQWIEQLSEMSGVGRATTEAIINDMTFGATRLLDMIVHPFVPLDDCGRRLGLVPHFVLASNAEENILRICSYVRPRFYNAASAQKEVEMREELNSCASPFHLGGPVRLRRDLPDIDLVVEDTKTSTVAICELKWGRKPYSVAETVLRDQELTHGAEQLEMVQRFLRDNPDFLRLRRVLSRSLNEYRRIEYLLVARDHMKWIAPVEQRSIVGFNPFKSVLERADFSAGVDRLLSYDWLPVEGRDFRVEFKDDTVNGVTMRSESFFPM